MIFQVQSGKYCSKLFDLRDILKETLLGNSLEVQWLGLHALTAKDLDLIPSQGTKISQAFQHHQKKKERKEPLFEPCPK